MSLAQRSLKDTEVSPHLLEAVEDLSGLWFRLEVEDEVILDQLLTLGRSSEYSDSLGVEMREMVTFCRSIAKRYRDSEQFPCDNMSIRSVSHVSAILNPGAVSPITQHTSVPNLPVLASSSSQISLTRLPKIPLPNFNGDIFQWPSFRDKFLVMLDQRPHLSNIDKLHYLLGCLKGPAADAVRGIPPSGDIYKLIWTGLESRFDESHLVAGSVVDTLLNTPPSTTESLSELNRFMLAFSESVSVLESLAIPNLGGFILFPLASRCLPSSCRILFEM